MNFIKEFKTSTLSAFKSVVSAFEKFNSDKYVQMAITKKVKKTIAKLEKYRIVKKPAALKKVCMYHHAGQPAFTSFLLRRQSLRS